MFLFDPRYFIMIAPAIILMIWAQIKVKSTYHRAMRVDARLSGAAAARYLLDHAGCENVAIEETRGVLSDHYDPRHRVLRLSHDVYHNHSAASVGIAAHEAGHAMQHATGYAPLALRNIAVPAAMVGPSIAGILFFIGIVFHSPGLLGLGIIVFSGFVFFQVVNLPVEFNASTRAKQLLTEHQIVDERGAIAVREVLNAAAWTYVAATLQSIMTLLYYIIRFTGSRRG